MRATSSTEGPPPENPPPATPTASERAAMERDWVSQMDATGQSFQRKAREDREMRARMEEIQAGYEAGQAVLQRRREQRSKGQAC